MGYITKQITYQKCIHFQSLGCTDFPIPLHQQAFHTDRAFQQLLLDSSVFHLCTFVNKENQPENKPGCHVIHLDTNLRQR